MTSNADTQKAREFNLRLTTALRQIQLIPDNVNAQALQVVNTVQHGEPVAIITCRLTKLGETPPVHAPAVHDVPGKPPKLAVLEGGRTMSRTKRKKLKARRKVEEDGA
jgi:hypothetical protein